MTQEKQKNNRRRAELMVIIIGSIYAFNMYLSLIRNDEPLWMGMVIFALVVLGWVIHVKGWHSYAFRICYIELTMLAGLLLYSWTVEEPYELVSYLLLYVVLFSLTGVSQTIYIFYFFIAIMLVLQHLQGHTPSGGDYTEKIKFGITFFNVAFSVFLLQTILRLRHQRMAEIASSMEELEQTRKGKDDFLANVSHELRTPVNTIIGLCEITEKENDIKKVKANLKNIQTAGQKLMFSISDILDFTELTAGQVDLEEENYNITSTIYDLVSMTKSRNTNKKVELIVDCNTNIPSGLLGDEKKIRRVVMNLLDNAVKFTEEGYIALHVNFREEGYGGNIIFDVEDSGIGIAPEDMDKIFSQFSQVDSARNRKKEGIGLGLAITLALVKQMGGVMTISSEKGKGTKVRLVIPQKISDRSPILQVKKKQECVVGIYIDLEKYDFVSIRDEYSRVIRHLVKNLGLKAYVCRNSSELKAHLNEEHLTHVFLGYNEYREDRPYYDSLPIESHVMVVCDETLGDAEFGKNIYRISKPLSILPVVKALNGEFNKDQTVAENNRGKFIAPEAKILIVDDNMMNLEVINEILKDYQIRPILASSGEEAIVEVKNAVFDFIFMDHMMPGMDGIETLHHIRTLPLDYAKVVPVIALTANEVAGAREMFLEEGFADFISKPIEIPVLERVLRRNLPSDKVVYLKQDAKIQEGKIRTYVNQTAIPQEQSMENATESSAEKAQEQAESPLDGLLIPGVDAEKGIYYCGGKERYEKILKSYYEKKEENRAKLLQLYEEENWKDYTVFVHGIKGSMISFGASSVGEIARSLEMAGKQSDIAFIRENHGKLLEAFDGFLKSLELLPFIEGEEKEEESAPAEEMKPLAFNAYQTRFEEAVFELDGEKMLAILKEMSRFSYLKQNLAKPMEGIISKVEMSDYIAAEEALCELRESIEKGAKGGLS